MKRAISRKPWRAVALFASLTALLTTTLLGCQPATQPTSRDADQGAREQSVPTRAAHLDHSALLRRAERAHGAPLKTPLKFAPVTAATLPPVTLPTAVEHERARIERHLFAGEVLTPDAGRHQLARYDAATHRVLHVAQHPDQEVLREAILGATLDALFASRRGDSDRTGQASGWDEWLTARAVADGQTAFGMMYDALRTTHRDAKPALLANRPDLSWSLPAAARLFTQTRTPGDALAAFTHREGMSFASAMYRAQGASGAALLHVLRPPSTAGLAHPERWMRGEEATRWTPDPRWSKAMGEKGWSPVGRGSVGAATGATLARRVMPGPQSWAVPGGWRSDHYVLHRRGHATAFTWFIQWETPHIAMRMAPMLQRAIKARAVGAGTTREVRAMIQGLTTVIQVVQAPGALTEVKPTLARLELLRHTRALTATRAGWPMTFIPSHGEQLSEGMQKQKLDSGAWRDDVLGLRMDTSALRGWTERLSTTLPVRWFARRGDELLQLTIELRDPFAPKFGSKAYTTSLQKNFQKTLPDATVKTSRVKDHTLGEGLALEIRGKVGAESRTITVWHFAHQHYTITFSLTAPSTAHAGALKDARKLVSTLRTASPSVARAAKHKPGGTGIVQFKVE